MTLNYKWARENYDLHRAQQEVAAIPLNINRAGRLYRKKLNEIRSKYNVTL